jgi:hypothetical protein
MRQRAVIVLDVPEEKGRENDQQNHENSHLTSDLERASHWPWSASEPWPAAREPGVAGFLITMSPKNRRVLSGFLQLGQYAYGLWNGTVLARLDPL